MAIRKYKTKAEAMAAIKLSIAKKNEYVAHVQRVWAEQNLRNLQSSISTADIDNKTFEL